MYSHHLTEHASFAASASISITVKNSTVEYGKTDLGINCDVSGTEVRSVLTIQLQRSNENIVSIAQGMGINWQDKELENRDGASVNASISSASSAYLHLLVLSTAVRYPKDMGDYQCLLSALDTKNALISPKSQIISVNLTGNFPLSFISHGELFQRLSNS
jgi:hypothetical protein